MAINSGDPAAETLFALDRRIRARVPATAIVTYEEPRFIRLLATVRNLPHHAEKKIFVWSRTHGMRELRLDGTYDRAVGDTEDPLSALEFIHKQDGKAIYVLCDFGPFLEEPGADILIRMLRELIWELKSRIVNMFLVGPSFPTIPSLEKEVHTLDLSLPSDREVRTLVTQRLDELRGNRNAVVSVDDALLEELIVAMAGFTEDEAETAFAMAAATLRGMSPDAIPLILEMKREVIRKSGSLEFRPPVPLREYGGYRNMIQLSMDAAATFSPDAREFGLEPFKGFLLLGAPGTGKDYLARVISSIVARALLSMDMGAVMGEGGGIIGQAAMSIRRALQIATALKPVLHIGEFEKGVGGLQSSNRSDGGETARTIGMLLNWMADQDSCLVVATANDVRQLAPEQIREGRFGTRVLVNLPRLQDRMDILSVHLRLAGRDPDDYGLLGFAERTDRFAAGELKNVIQKALTRAYMDGKRELRDGDVTEMIRRTHPNGRTNQKEIDDLERYATEVLGAVPASSDDEPDLLTAPSPATRSRRPVEV